MRNIVIVDAYSTGYNLVEDVTRRGYNPVVLATMLADDLGLPGNSNGRHRLNTVISKT